MQEHMAHDLLTKQTIKRVYGQSEDGVIRVEGYSDYRVTVNEDNDGEEEICISYINIKVMKK